MKKNKTKTKNNKMIINSIKLVIFIIMLSLFIYFGTKDFASDIKDNVRFANEYKDISKDNLYIYCKAEEILRLLDRDSGVIFLGFPDNIWSHYYAEYLNDVAISEEIDKIYYYDFERDRSIRSNKYESIVIKLKNYLIASDTNHYSLNAPTILIVKNGNVIYFNDDIQTIRGDVNPEDYFTEYKQNYLKSEITNAIKLYKGELD